MASQHVVLVHGIFDTGVIFRRMARRLRRERMEPLAIDLHQRMGTVPIERLAEHLEEFIRQRVPEGSPIDLVGFSMGGVVARYYVQRLGGIARVRRLVCISTPHSGSRIAHLLPIACARQLRPGNALLTDLARDADSLAACKVASIWTPYDLMIQPASSCSLGVGEDYRIRVALHALMVRDRRVLDLLVRLLRVESDLGGFGC